MNDYIKMFIAMSVLFVVLMLTKKFHAWKIKRAYFSIVKEIRAKKAFDSQTAVNLSYARSPMFRVGLRDVRPIALEHLVQDSIVGVTDDGKYYLKDKNV
ncbi:MAG: hypothetical protein JSW26_02110 [Desulfobacterales bacterium]|nr:MAG: hypothetical protein JSW26_02110 [Desulfobacterales bacterium]